MKSLVVLSFALTVLVTVGCTVRAYGPGPIPIVVQGSPPPPPPRRAPPPAYAPPPPAYAQPSPAQQPAGAPPPAACLDPAERDFTDQFDHAVPIDPNSTTVGCTFRGDGDMFVVNVPPANAGLVIRYALRGQYELAPLIQVFDANRKRVAHESGGKSQELRGWIHAAGGTFFYVRVAQVHGATEAYSLALASGPLVEPTEPNGSVEQATVMPASGQITGFMGNPLNDPGALEDWYRVEVGHDGELAVTVDMSQDIAPIVQLFDGNRRRLEHKSGGRGERIPAAARVRHGTHYIRVSSMHGVPFVGTGDPGGWLTRPYTLTVSR